MRNKITKEKWMQFALFSACAFGIFTVATTMDSVGQLVVVDICGVALMIVFAYQRHLGKLKFKWEKKKELKRKMMAMQ
jgi:hypothetical protein